MVWRFQDCARVWHTVFFLLRISRILFSVSVTCNVLLPRPRGYPRGLFRHGGIQLSRPGTKSGEDEMTGWIYAGGAVTGAAALFGLWLASRKSALTPVEARRQFQQQREHLEAEFFQAVATSGKPRGLRWKECDWGDNVV